MRAADAEEALFVELWQLRRSLVNVRPGIPPEEDYSAFRAFFADEGALVYCIYDADNVIHGFLGWSMRPLDVPGAPVVIIDSDYYFVKPSVRRHLVMVEMAFGFFARAAARYRRRRVAIVGHGYPSSVLSGARFSTRVRFPQDEDVAPWEREAMIQFAERFCGASFDRERCLVRMRTTPAAPRRVPRSAEGRWIFARFETYSPDWTLGWGLSYIMHWTPGSILKGVLRFAAG